MQDLADPHKPAETLRANPSQSLANSSELSCINRDSNRHEPNAANNMSRSAEATVEDQIVELYSRDMPGPEPGRPGCRNVRPGRMQPWL